MIGPDGWVSTAACGTGTGSGAAAPVSDTVTPVESCAWSRPLAAPSHATAARRRPRLNGLVIYAPSVAPASAAPVAWPRAPWTLGPGPRALLEPQGPRAAEDQAPVGRLGPAASPP